MPVKVLIPSQLRRLTNGLSETLLEGATVRDVVAELEKTFPNLRGRLFDAKGEIRRFVRIFKNNEDTTSLQGAATPVADGDEISIVPAVFGG